jgi:hypothetical protein
LDSPKNQIEIWYDRKKTKHRRHGSGFVAFPVYNRNKTEITEEYDPGIYVEQQAIGFVGSYELNIESFNLEDLQFNLL